MNEIRSTRLKQFAFVTPKHALSVAKRYGSRIHASIAKTKSTGYLVIDMRNQSSYRRIGQDRAYASMFSSIKAQNSGSSKAAATARHVSLSKNDCTRVLCFHRKDGTRAFILLAHWANASGSLQISNCSGWLVPGATHFSSISSVTVSLSLSICSISSAETWRWVRWRSDTLSNVAGRWLALMVS